MRWLSLDKEEECFWEFNQYFNLIIRTDLTKQIFRKF